MVERQLRGRDIVDERVLAAMERVPRELFVPEPERSRAYDDAALPIGHGQTISQPYMVARICEALDVREGQRVLDVGTGSGYQAAVLAELGAEVVTDRADPRARRERTGESRRGRATRTSRSRSATARSACPSARRSTGSPSRRRPPGCRRRCTSSSCPGGRLVVPVGGPRAQLLEVIVRSPEGPAVVHSVPCRFVPLVGEEGFSG